MWIEIVGCLAFIIGHILGKVSEAWYWRNKATEPRTAVCSAGKFYYVVTEHEYVQQFSMEQADD